MWYLRRSPTCPPSLSELLPCECPNVIDRINQGSDVDVGVPSVTVVIPAFTMDRWDLMGRAVRSVVHQTRPPEQVIVCIDNNPELLERSTVEWGGLPFGDGGSVEVIPNEHSDHLEGRGEHIRVHGTSRRFGAGSARNTAVRRARADVVAFLDDDAEAEDDWLECLVQPYADSEVVAVGGAPLPRYERRRPDWFPSEFDWVFGCAYTGLPTSLAPLRHLIGANMSVRRQALTDIGGFQSVDFDDMDMCHRLANAFPAGRIMYTPDAVVHHFVSANRVSWNYFWRRCFHVNKQKVRAFAEMGDAANLASERNFVTNVWTRQLYRHLRQFVGGDVNGALQLFASLVGVSLAAAGNLAGRISLALERRSVGGK